MITPDRLEAWRRTGAVAGTHGSPSGNALLDACDEIESLQIAIDREMAKDTDHINDALKKVVEAEAGRDRARDAAVALEQENAYLTELTATCTCYDGDPQNYEGVHVDCAVHGAVRAFNETQATIERVRELHAKFVCGCGDDHQIGCKECRDSEYPCPTIHALDGGEAL